MEVSKRQAAEGDGDDHPHRDDKERHETAVEAAMIPSRGTSRLLDDKHILLGRGKGANSHPGNIRMRLIVDKHRAHYKAIGRGEKYQLVKKVYEELISGGTKFMKPSEKDDGWEEVSAQVAITKVGHSIRCSKNRRKCDVTQSKAITGRSKSSLPSERTSMLKASPPSRIRSSQVGQDLTLGPQYTTATSMTSIEEGLISRFPLARNETMRLGVPSLLSSPLSSLDAYLVEMQNNRLRSGLFVATGPLPLSGTLSGSVSASQFHGLMEQQQQIRELLLLQQLMSSQNAELPSRHSG
eukprot:CAMPEP_0113608770 /NCGR_PEP_ID=MMETSP0017_2-20120614/4108_1 /TAXON_ID=2856 /ORGANISM="Cylindrotheca closterium" /LENGTH=295 /DNA_ID=CAMNT_0000517489 /DNA_START=113 /DNA_END=1000 /DNA_ORIENTATION=- /assembly_acc=CAM_ASM_000147